jgi:hypothetical protein
MHDQCNIVDVYDRNVARGVGKPARSGVAVHDRSAPERPHPAMNARGLIEGSRCAGTDDKFYFGTLAHSACFLNRLLIDNGHSGWAGDKSAALSVEKGAQDFGAIS